MKLQSLHITLNNYGADSGRYTGSITYDNRHGETKLILDPVISDKVLAFIGPVITAAAGAICGELEKAIQQGVEESKAAAKLLGGPIEIDAQTKDENESN